MKWFLVTALWKESTEHDAVHTANYIIKEWPDIAYEVYKIRLAVIMDSGEKVLCHSEISPLGDLEVEIFKSFCTIL